MSTPTLVAGIGNIFFRDDGFGPEVVRRLANEPDRLPGIARVVDYGIRGMHLAFDLLDEVALLVLVDAVPGKGDAGSIEVLEVRSEHVREGGLDTHSMSPDVVLGNLEKLGGRMPTTFVVGCVPADIGEGIGLSSAVEAAIPDAIEAVGALLRERVEV